MIEKYLNIKHEYGKFDCISLIQQFYKQELNIIFELPAYTYSRKWYKQFTVESIDTWAAKYSKKVFLTDLRNYDLISFSSNKKYINHFGLYLTPYSLLHVEEGNTSRIDNLSSYWVSNIYAIYRHNDLV